MSLQEHSGKHIVPLWIDGKAVPVAPERLLEVVSASQDKVVHHAQSASEDDARRAVDAAAVAFPSWSTSSHSERRRIILKFADLMEEHADELAELGYLETSARKDYGCFQCKLGVQVIREIAGNITAALTGHVPPKDDTGFVFVSKEAIGPVLCIPPWNSPLILGPRGIASALAAGCTVVLKASELCPRLFLRAAELFHEAGLPAGCLNMIQTGREQAQAVTEALIAHKEIRKVEFIGSASVGRIIGQLSAKYLKPVLMELGGKGPVLILKDANLAKAAKSAAFGAFLHHGQICMSTERLIVVQEVADEFKSLLKREVENDFADGVVSSAAVSKASAEKARKMLEQARNGGAEFLVGDNSIKPGTGNALTPTVVVGVKREDTLYDQETFSPSASLYVVRDTAAAIELANDSVYGLSAAVWTNDVMDGLDVCKRLQYGQVHINSTTINDNATVPMSGVKASGWGDNNSVYGIHEFLINKTVSIHRATETTNFGKS